MRYIIVLFIGSLFFANLSFAGTNTPPFKRGEVAVYAIPSQLSSFEVKKHLPLSGISILNVEPGKELGLIQRLQKSGKRAGLNLIAKRSLSDPYYPLQWHLQSVQAEQAWQFTTGNNVAVAVLDTGLKPGGNDGVRVCEPFIGKDIVSNDNDPNDGDGHGTHVSGTIAQNSDNATGVAGLAYGACVVPVKVLNDSGSGSFADIAEGIYYAVANGAKVINMSLGTNARFALTNDPIMDPALDYAFSKGVTVVAASGNDGHRKNVSYPAIYPTTIAVGATDYRNQLTRYSNQGQGLDMVAPGGDVKRDDNGDGYGDGVLQEMNAGTWNYYFLNGTSMASPHVAAAAALLLAKEPNLSVTQVKQRLFDYAQDLGKGGYDSQYGHGLLQVYNSLSKSSTNNPPPVSGDDADGDGYTVADGDCDDTDASIHPGANDTRGKKGRDGIDNDCNGIIDG
ncbi:S8 family serine peptidase [Thiomicrorhabdus sediminis]|uniref:Serine proteinase n=1 Tax=Thiomicrorhabdus sediminis TaxID=2580412 RepID=A0A4P9K4B0_9GAMM|nr:S8 family serine peptidase [Thiomicrorhabdus sediminis]QCU89794.1 serine proteinase [Thiomicrorhabdus sediminis]